MTPVTVAPPVTFSDDAVNAPLTVNGTFILACVRRTSIMSLPPARTANRSPVALASALTMRPLLESIGVLTCSCAAGLFVPIPTRPKAPVMRMRSSASVLKVIALSPAAPIETPPGVSPAVASDSAPSVARTVRLPSLVTSGVTTEVLAMTEVPAVTVVPAVMVEVAATVVKEPAARVVPPMVTPLMLPPVRATRLLRNAPSSPLMITRTSPLVTMRRSCSSRVPRNREFADGALPRAPPLLPPELPSMSQVFSLASCE